ncbi:hypothetical protein [Rhodopila sp.]|uniref:hypothetical protein n=1 Tax=Rhodopila sp. TaxID=2480087 RepID=UPI003D0F2D94
MKTPDPNSETARQAFVDAYVASGSPVSAAITAGWPERMAVSIGLEMISTPEVQGAIVRAMPDGDAKLAFAAKWMLDLDGNPVEPVTLATRIQAARERLVAEALEREQAEQPILITIVRSTRPERGRPPKKKAVAP